jgi:hypothetical protein
MSKTLASATEGMIAWNSRSIRIIFKEGLPGADPH